MQAGSDSKGATQPPPGVPPAGQPLRVGLVGGPTGSALERIGAAFIALAEEAMIVCDERGRITSINPAFTAITGFTADEVLGLPLRHLRSPRHPARFYGDAVRRALAAGVWREDMWCQRRHGQTFPAWLTLSTLRDAQGRLSHFLVVLSDIARLSERHSHLEHMAHHDVLTGLPNRMLLLSRLDGALARSRRMKHLGAVLFLDLDLFKEINDGHGHPAGDEVLREVARRLNQRIRESDLAARYGGDEFVVLLEELDSPESAGDVARTIIDLLQGPIVLQSGISCRVATSIGIAIFQGDSLGPEELIRRADEAMFDAKRHGRATFRHYTQDRANRAIG